MAVITEPIGTRNFELIRDRLHEILSDELENQIAIQYLDSDYPNLNIFLERWVAIDNTEYPCVNISLAQGDFDNMKPLDLSGSYIYHVDCYCAADSTTDNLGDDTSAFKLHRLLGLCHKILMHTKYNTLGYQPGFIQRIEVQSMPIIEPDRSDALNLIRGRLIVKVTAAELNGSSTPRLLNGHDTKIILDETGYTYTYNP